MSDSLPIKTYSSVEPFLTKMRRSLEANEPRSSLVLGMTGRLQKDPHYYGEADPYLATVETEQETVAAIMTPPYGLALFFENETACDQAILKRIASNLHDGGWQVPTIHCTDGVAARFAEIWNELSGTTSDVEVRMRLFELRSLNAVDTSPGHLRLATTADIERVNDWLFAFEQEVIHQPQDRGSIRKAAERRTKNGTIYFWETDQPVCLVGTARPTKRGISIGPVYTPPEFRGRGFATSAVSQLSQKMLDDGKEFCTLFTDLANPTSNHIYRTIGYVPVDDVAIHRFHTA